MPRLIAFTQITLDGYFTDRNGDMSWAHQSKPDPEWSAFAAENASGGGQLLFGRVTYEMMQSFWPTPRAAEAEPTIARHMNELPKVVISRTLSEVSWQNTRLLKGDLVGEVRKLKQEPAGQIAILGSGSIVAQLSSARLIDEYHVVIYPVALGGGRAIFAGIERQLRLKQTRSRTFQNGNVLVCYEPAS